MPAPLLLPLIGAGISALGTGGQIFSNIAMNNKNLRFQRDMYDRQRRDALSDWNMTNEYNSPQQQMQRLKNAGLNPNLVYGNGAVANSSGQPQNATPNRNFSPMQLPISQVGDVMGQYMTLKAQQQQMQLTESAIALNKAKTLTEMEKPDLVKEQAMKTFQDWQLSGQKFTQSNILFPEVLQAKKLLVDDITQSIKYKAAQTDMSQDENARRNQMQGVNFMLNLERILALKASEAKSYSDREYIAAQINKLNNEATQREIQTGFKVFGLDFNVHGKSKGLFYEQNSNINSIMNVIDKNWYKKDKQEKDQLIKKLSQNIFH